MAAALLWALAPAVSGQASSRHGPQWAALGHGTDVLGQGRGLPMSHPLLGTFCPFGVTQTALV